ncbi:MAG: PepSY domain-containing protein [Lutibacter sp.]|uniref:PepSY-associated TM helix domain-containing protein n=1 Tax=Lutibacter sp. TaxID=1925666 RepID=UPI001796373B|nr:PepSY-associated TM helix domain-containing protein [Lutibacter sp.]MBT8316359.1 PepSY domain-containing protein [Lutibacter sp.]NNJ57219.1 PepSY domain-containing protein [Lutibacter sp.]
MVKEKSTQKQAKILRLFRKIHRITGAMLFVFFFIIAITGILLGLKSNSNGLILPKTTQGTDTNLKNWLPIDSLHNKAILILQDSIQKDLSLELDRIDIRKNKGIVKFIFENHYWEIQLDGATGKLLSVAKRHSDLIEDLHDATILDRVFNTSQTQIKLLYTLIMGLALLLFTITGFWLWYGPKRLKKSRKALK